MVSDFNLEAIFNFNCNVQHVYLRQSNLGYLKKFEFQLQLKLKMASKSKSETRFPCTVGGLHAKSGLRFSIRDDIHGEYVRIWAKSVLKPRFYHKNLSFLNRVLAYGRQKIYEDAAPWGAGHPTGLRLFFLFFSTIRQNPI